MQGQAIGIALLAWPSSEIDPDQPPEASGSVVDFDDVQLDANPTASVVPGLSAWASTLLGLLLVALSRQVLRPSR